MTPTLTLVGILWGCLFFSFPFVESFYFTFVTLTTIGFGDVSPPLGLASGLWIIYMLFGLGTVANLLSVISNEMAEYFKEVGIRVRERIRVWV